MNNFQRLKIFHPTDFSEESEIAFEHALKLVLSTQGALEILHVTSKAKAIHRKDLPNVRSALEHWDVLPEGSSVDAVGDLHLHVRKVVYRGNDPVEACKDYLERHPVDLIVMAVHQGISWFRKSVGKPIARESREITLFLPQGVVGFVSAETGDLDLKRVLLPIAHEPQVKQGVRALERLVKRLELNIDVTLLYVGDEDDVPEVKLNNDNIAITSTLIKKGNIDDVIVATAEEVNADLVVMVTEGRHGFIDALRGSVSERVLKKIRCPLLSVPNRRMYYPRFLS